MDGRRTLIWGGALTALVLLSLGGAAAYRGSLVGAAAGSSGCNGEEAATVPEEVPADIRVVGDPGRPDITAGPTDGRIAQEIVPNWFVFKITPKAAAQLDYADDRVSFGTELSLALDQITHSEPVWTFHEADSAWIRHFREIYVSRFAPDRIQSTPEGPAVEPPGTVFTGVPFDTMPGLERISHVQIEYDPIPGRAEEIVAQLEAIEGIEWAEPMVAVHAATTDDAYQGYQWTHDVLQVERMWTFNRGEDVRVGVVDSGVATVADGYRRLLDGCVDLIGDSTTCAHDPNGHGTFIAGVLANTPDNGVGVAGIAPEAEVLSIRVLDENGDGRVTDAALGIALASQQDADVITAAWGTYAPSRVLYEAVVHATNKGSVVVGAAGNDGFTETVMYPARYDRVISVGCATMSGEICPMSNRGVGVDIFAPGGDIGVDDDLDGVPDGVLAESRFDNEPGTWVMGGTSPATATASGVIALMIAQGADPASILEILQQTADHGTLKVVGTISPADAIAFTPPEVKKAAGESCLNGFECQTGVCEGQGCDDKSPGTCSDPVRQCTLDLRPYCGCDNRTFYASSTCPNRRYLDMGSCPPLGGTDPL